MILKEKISSDLISSLKAKDSLRVNVLKLLKSSLGNKEIDLKKELEDEEVLSIIFSEAKKRKDSIVQFKSGGREDLAENEAKELIILEEYLPEMKSKEDVKDIICDIIEVKGIEKNKGNFGLLMKLSMEKLKGEAEGNLVSEVVKELLA